MDQTGWPPGLNVLRWKRPTTDVTKSLIAFSTEADILSDAARGDPFCLGPVGRGWKVCQIRNEMAMKMTV